MASKPSKITTDAEPRNMLHLPLELLFCITKHLPTGSIACLALCNRSLYDIFAYDYLPLLRRFRRARLRFLTALVKEHPGYYVCHGCIKLHTCNSVRKPGTPPNDKRLLLHKNSAYALQYVHVQLAMECHRRGPKFGIPLDIFEHTEVEINKDHGTVTLISTEARIASNKLLLRTQTCILGPPKPRTVSNKVHALSFCRRIGITLCHGSPMDGPMDNRFVKYKPSIYDMLWECWDCLSDDRIDFLDFGGPGNVIVAARWFNLGSGMQPGDAK
jgi:hypothetical protein